VHNGSKTYLKLHSFLPKITEMAQRRERSRSEGKKPTIPSPSRKVRAKVVLLFYMQRFFFIYSLLLLFLLLTVLLLAACYLWAIIEYEFCVLYERETLVSHVNLNVFSQLDRYRRSEQFRQLVSCQTYLWPGQGPFISQLPV